jgi:LEA14-like dessication related protein
MKHIRTVVIVCCFSMLFSACKSTKQAQALRDCNYSFASISNLKVGDVYIQGKQSFRDLSLQETMGLSQLLMARKLPVSLTAHIAIQNPNSKTAAIDALEWILEVRSKEVAKGEVTKRVEVKPGQTIQVPIDVATDLGNIFKAFTMKEITDVMFNISNADGIPIEAKLKIKPSITVGRKQIKAPSYFVIDVMK